MIAARAFHSIKIRGSASSAQTRICQKEASTRRAFVRPEHKSQDRHVASALEVPFLPGTRLHAPHAVETRTILRQPLVRA